MSHVDKRRAAILSMLILLSSTCAVAQPNPGNSSLQSSSEALRSGRFDDALKALEPLVRSSPNDPKLLSMQGFALAGLHRDDEALTSYSRALEASSDYLPALEGAAQIKYARNDADARALLEHILRLRPEDATSHAMLGALAFRQGECAAAVEHFERGRAVVNRTPAALKQFGLCLAQLQRNDQAKTVFVDLVDMTPDDADAREHLASLQLADRDPKGALMTLQPILQSPMDTRLSELASACYEASGDTQEAVTILNRALAEHPKDIDLYVDLARMAYDHHSFLSGINVMTAGLKILPNAAPLYLERGILYVQLAEYNKAEQDFDRAAELDPQESLSAVSRGKIAEQVGDFDKALETIEGEIAKKPKDATLLYTRAEILVQKGIKQESAEFRLAEQSLEQAVKLQPDLLLARNLLTTLYLREGRDKDAAQQAQLVLANDPQNEAALYHLIMALRKSGNRQELSDLVKRFNELQHGVDQIPR